MSPTGGVVVGWRVGASGVGLVRSLAGGLLGRDPGPLHHACPSCGSSGHGRPAFDAAVHVSLAYAPPYVVAAASLDGPVGVDAEAADRVREPGLADVVLHPDEDELSAYTWVRKEALLKATGRGLRDDPRTIHLRGTRVVSGPTPSWVYDVPVPSGFVAAVACLSPDPPGMRVALAGRPTSRPDGPRDAGSPGWRSRRSPTC